MIRTISVKETASHNNLSLPTIQTVVGTVNQVRIIDVPKQIGLWKITGVSIQVTYPNGTIINKSCTLTGGCYHCTLTASSTSGKSIKGFRILATGIDENGQSITPYELGHSDVVVYDLDGVVIDEGTLHLAHILEESPSESTVGDIYDEDGTIHITTFNGTQDIASINDIPTKTSQLTNDSGFITQHQSLSDYASKQWVEDKNYLTEHQSLSSITDLIPTQATTQNQLADKSFVNSSITTNTAYFKGTFNSVEELPTTEVTNNDYAFVIRTDAVGQTFYDRYKYNSSNTSWMFEYSINNSGFTAVQYASINSGITSGKVSTYDGYQQQITNNNLSVQDIYQQIGNVEQMIRSI